MAQHDYEKLGAFYLGRVIDPETGETREDAPLLYESKDLTTHGVCVGMTGSGKTGLCLSLIEEAAIDGIPVLAIDPKGDLGNLMLTFPELRPTDFEPWIDSAEATRKGMKVPEYAKKTADTWKKGLESWDQSGERIQKLKDAAEFNLYTPGSNAGTPLTVLRSFNAPPQVIIDDPELMAERVEAAVSGVLALLGIDADPLQSREHILLSNLLQHHWALGQNLDLPGILRGLQEPPFERIGFFDLESFYPAKDRFDLAMRLNNLLASPGFQVWMEGEPLDIPSLLFAKDGRPKVSILSIAHLGESERMFFVTILLNELLAWMRTQPGTSSLRALLYMDEIFGYFPPNGNPPSKRPMLTLLKQARAYGVGCMLATQNPVDLDYKGLSNTGTWFIGRLQTERDKLRVLDGLEGAAGDSGFNRSEVEKVLSGLGSRKFLLHNVHESGPVVFNTRWAMSYLRGPLTRTQIRQLCAGSKPTPKPKAVTEPAEPKVPALPDAPPPKPASIAKTEPPTLSSRIPMAWMPLMKPQESVEYRPMLLAMGRLHYVKASASVDKWQDIHFLIPFPGKIGMVKWNKLEEIEAISDLPGEAPVSGTYAKLPPSAMESKNYTAWKKEATSHLYQHYCMEVYACKPLKMKSITDETEAAFRGRVSLAAREARDLKVGALKRKYEAKFNTQRDRLARAENKVEVETSQHKQQKMSTALNFGATILGAFLGRKKVSTSSVSKAGSTMRSAGRASKEKDDIARAEDNLVVQQERMLELETKFEEDLSKLEETYAPETIDITVSKIAPRKSDLRFVWFGLCWVN